MTITDPEAVCRLIQSSPFRYRVLKAVRAIELPDCWVGAGFVRNAVWDHLHGFDTPTPLGDIDVIWFDADRAASEIDDIFAARLATLLPNLPWSVKNQARMHRHNGDRPYASATQAMCYWPETATAVAVRLTHANTIDLAAPFGLDDLIAMIVRPTPHFRQHRMEDFFARQERKNWRARWPRLTPEWEPSDKAPANRP